MSQSSAKRGTITLYAPRSKNEQEFMYSGKAPGMTFEAFDECVLSWGRDKFGERFAKALWRDELVKLEQLDLSDELDELFSDLKNTAMQYMKCFCWSHLSGRIPLWGQQNLKRLNFSVN
jgi:hypothetical protein